MKHQRRHAVTAMRRLLHALLQALNQQTPATAIMPGGARAAAMATTVQRQPRPTRFSFAAGAAVLDLERCAGPHIALHAHRTAEWICLASK